MRLVLFSSFFPCEGEPFLSQEFDYTKKNFDEIIVVSSSKNGVFNGDILSANVKVLFPRVNKGCLSRLYGATVCSLSFSFWREVFLGCKERGIRKAFSVFLKTFLTCDYIRHLKRYENFWKYEDKDTIYYSYWLDAAATYLAKRKKHLNGLCISRAHGGDCFFDRGYIPFRKEQLQELDAVFTISEAGKKDIISHYGDIVSNLEDKIFVSRLGIKLPRNKTSFNHFENQKTIVTCSNVIPLKRLDLIIDAIAQFNSLNINWIHFGDGCEMENIMALAKQKLSSKSNIRYEFKGRVPNEQVLAFYDNNRVDLFVNCSDSEGIPVSVMEAMARGIPAIARDVGANSELVNNHCGILLPKDITASDLYDAINSVFSLSQEDYLKLQQNAIAYVSDNYNAKQNYIDFFDKLKEMSL